MTAGPTGPDVVGRVTVDRDLCVSSGMCESVAPAVFEIDDDGGLAELDSPEPATPAAEPEEAEEIEEGEEGEEAEEAEVAEEVEPLPLFGTGPVTYVGQHRETRAGQSDVGDEYAS